MSSTTTPETDADILDLYQLFGQTQQLLLQTIPETVGKLSSLKQFRLVQNNLRALPKSILEIIFL